MSAAWFPPASADAVVDLSHWQAEVDFAALKAGGIAGVILKATQGRGWVDPDFVMRAGEAQAAGLLVGAYHFCDDAPPAMQAIFFLALAGHLPLLALDVEANAIGPSAALATAAEIAARVQMQTGRAPLVYISRWGPDGRGTGLPNQVLSHSPLWLPEYGSEPVCPAGWQQWKLWQYTDRGETPGIVGGCDRNRFAGTLDELAVWWNGTAA